MRSLAQTVLFSLAVFGDIVKSLPTTKRGSWNFWTGSGSPTDELFNRRSFTVAVSRLLSTERIEKTVKGGKVRIKITPKGLKFLAKELDLEKFGRKRWDGEWRTVIFDIEEKNRGERNFLRRQLKYLGFGMLQESTWISPFPIEGELDEMVRDWSLHGEILFMKSKILSGDEKEIVERVWGLDELLEGYCELREFWENLAEEDLNKRNAFKFQQSYFELLQKDPFLPQPLLGDGWEVRDELKNIYLKEVCKVLSS